MPSYLPESRDIRVAQQPGGVNSKAIEAIDQLLLILPERIPGALWKRIPQGARLQALLKKRGKGELPALQARLIERTDEHDWHTVSLFETELAPLVHGALPPKFSF